MTRFNLTALILLAASLATPAFATNGFTTSDKDFGGSYHAMPGGKTREEVKAELVEAIKDGSLTRMRSEAGFAPEFESSKASTLTRAEVLSELKRARDDGSLARMNRNEGYTPNQEMTAGRSGLSREQVLGELQRAQEDGTLQCLHNNNARNC